MHWLMMLLLVELYRQPIETAIVMLAPLMDWLGEWFEPWAV